MPPLRFGRRRPFFLIWLLPEYNTFDDLSLLLPQLDSSYSFESGPVRRNDLSCIGGLTWIFFS